MNLARRLRREAQSDDRSWTRLQLLGAISRAGDRATPTMLAESESMRSSNLAAALRGLERDKLIARRPHAEDGRKVHIGLTPLGRRILQENIKQRERWLAEAMDKLLTQDERALLFKAGALFDRIAGYPASPHQREMRARTFLASTEHISPERNVP